MAPGSSSFAALDEALNAERIRLERVLYRVVLARLARRDASGRMAARMMARLEADMDRLRSEPGEESRAAPTAFDQARQVAARAPEPYRTMLMSHLERLERIDEELRTGNAGDESVVPLDGCMAEIGYRAARGALAGSIAVDLASFARKHGSTTGPA